MSIQSQTTEQQVIGIFRLFVILYLLSFLVFVLGNVFFLHTQPPLIRIISTAAVLLMLLSLLQSPSQRWLGRFYVPALLLVATAAPLLENQLLLWRQSISGGGVSLNPILSALLQPDPTFYNAVGLQGVWSPVLFLPLMVIAWRYKFRYVLIFSVGTMVADIVLYALLSRHEPQMVFSLCSALISRTLAFGCVGYMVFRLSHAEQKQRNALEQINQRLVNHTTTLEQLAISRERNRIARELHDTLAHTLSATSIQLEASIALWQTNPTKAQELIQRSLTMTRSGLTETRHVLAELRASPLEDLGLLLALRQLALQYAQHTGWKLTLDLPNTLDEISLPLEQTLYRAAQEALANIDRHAHAQQVTMRLQSDKNRLCLSIQDDGCGFTPINVNEQVHLGLRGMRERVETTGGCLEIRSAPGQGTTLTLRLETTL
jgi:signal transduction histidine kinase